MLAGLPLPIPELPDPAVRPAKAMALMLYETAATEPGATPNVTLEITPLQTGVGLSAGSKTGLGLIVKLID